MEIGIDENVDPTLALLDIEARYWRAQALLERGRLVEALRLAEGAQRSLARPEVPHAQRTLEDLIDHLRCSLYGAEHRTKCETRKGSNE